MRDLYLFSLLSVLLTQYGFQPRRRVIERIKAGWLWRRSAIRLGLWLASGAVLASQRMPIASFMVIILAAWLLTEVSVALHRWFVTSSIKRGSAYGSVLSHLSVVPVVLVALAGIAILLSPTVNIIGGTLPDLAIAPLLPLAVSFIALWGWATLMTVSVIELVRPEEVVEADEQETMWGRGEVIGILERLITYLLILNGSPTAVALVVAAKSAARFPAFKKEAFAEYFLVGTLTSVGMAVAVGILPEILK